MHHLRYRRYRYSYDGYSSRGILESIVYGGLKNDVFKNITSHNLIDLMPQLILSSS